MYWGEGRQIEENIPARLIWQPLQEVSGNLWLDSKLFNHPMWKNYRPDEMQPLFFRVKKEDYIQTIWVDEYDVKAYVREWKNAPVFRLKRVEFTKKDAFKKKLSYKKAEGWFVIPGSLVKNDEDVKKSPIQTINIPVFQKKARLLKELLAENMEHCKIKMLSGLIDETPATFVQMTGNEALQGNPSSAYSAQFKVSYGIISGVLALLTCQNLKPVWQIMRQTGILKDKWLELVYYEDGAPRRNPFPDNELIKGDYSVTSLFSLVVNLPLPKFRNYLEDIHLFEEILATNDILPRFQKATALLNRLIGWCGNDFDNWPEKLKGAISKYHVPSKSEYFVEEHFLELYDRYDYWHPVMPPLDSLRVLLADRSPEPGWFAGKKIKERNEVVMQLLAELIIGKYLKLKPKPQA